MHGLSAPSVLAHNGINIKLLLEYVPFEDNIAIDCLSPNPYAKSVSEIHEKLQKFLMFVVTALSLMLLISDVLSLEISCLLLKLKHLLLSPYKSGP